MTVVKARPKDVMIVDYKVGNYLSIANALKFLGYTFNVSDKKEDVEKATAFILPGVGAFPEAMDNLKKLDLVDVLNEQVLVQRKPILGICLGMQIMAEDSEENGLHQGLGWIHGHVKQIPVNSGVRVPHVGWNNLNIMKKDPMFARTTDNPHFYFDHSYHFDCHGVDVAATSSYGIEIVAAVQKDNIFGVQFHPEKSQSNGLRLLRGFFSYMKVWERGVVEL